MQYLHRDHLGSIDKITDASGNILQTLAFEPFGSRKNSDWQQNIDPAELDDLIANLNIRTAKGFTGHEHLDRTGFIHMNGRVYDPTLGRFLSPDPVVQAPTNSQSWNRYSYVLNNPLSYTDPTGNQFAPVPVSYQETTTGYEVTSLIDAFSYSSISISWGGGGGFGSAAFASTYKRDNITVLVFSLFTSFGGGYGGGGIDGGGFGGGPTITYSLTIVLVFSTESIVSDAYQVHVVKDRAMPVGVKTHQGNAQKNTQNQPSGVQNSNAQNQKIIDSTSEAWNHYQNGNGETVELGPNTKNALRNHPEQLRRAERIRTGQTSRSSGNYGVDLTGDIFHVGDTRVDYTTTCEGDTCTTTYTGFSGDGFWDANVLAPWSHDGIGSGGELLGGTPYKYEPYIWREEYPNPN